MRMYNKIKIGNTIRISDTGHQYCGYVVKAMELGADVSPYIRAYYNNHGSTHGMKQGIAMADRSPKWIYESHVKKGDICEVLNMDQRNGHVLVERMPDGRQFLMDAPGCEVIKETFGDKDFLL